MTDNEIQNPQTEPEATPAEEAEATNAIAAEAVETPSDSGGEPGEPRKKRRRWMAYRFDEAKPPMAKFDLEPVTDIPIRLAVEEGAIRNKRDLTVYKTTEDWQEFAKGTVIIAQEEIETGQPFAVFIGDGRKIAALERKRAAQETESTQETASTDPAQTPKAVEAAVHKERGIRSTPASTMRELRKRRLRAKRRALGIDREKQNQPMSRKRLESIHRLQREAERQHARARNRKKKRG
ncbi:MAG: hypothetical protein GC154_18190 [bacterium]|nr:hypothetical protein [bacterium]